MNSIYSVALSFSQSEVGAHQSAHVAVAAEDMSVTMHLRWDLAPEYDSQIDPGTWLYRQLAHLVENFDDHDIVNVKLNGVEQMKEIPSA